MRGYVCPAHVLVNCMVSILYFLTGIIAVNEKVLVGIIMGSQSDWETMQHAAATLDSLGVAHETRVVSA